MWPTLERARRRLTRGGSSPSNPVEGPVVAGDVLPAPTSHAIADLVIVLGTAELQRLRAALQQLLGDAVERPDTPARIERALSLLLAHRNAPGRPRVLRLPAGLSTPESWEIHLDGTDEATALALRAAGRTGVFGS